MIELASEDYRALVAEVARLVRHAPTPPDIPLPADSRPPADAVPAAAEPVSGLALAPHFLARGASRIVADLDPRSLPKLAQHVEYALLGPAVTPAEVERACDEARDLGLAGVCVAPAWIALAASQLRGSPVLACTAIGFPNGSTTASVKQFEAGECLKLGADEIALSLGWGALKAGLETQVYEEIRGVAALARAAGGRTRVAWNITAFTGEETTLACRLARDAGADFVQLEAGHAAHPAPVTLYDLERVQAALGLPPPRLGAAPGTPRDLALRAGILVSIP